MKNQCLYYDLLDDEVEERLSKNPNLLRSDIEGKKIKPKWVVIDEVQKIPRLLDVIQSLIVKDKIKFILTGSSARKLKINGANLLAGRAFDYRLYPFSFIELAENFNLKDALNYGLLPGATLFKEKNDKVKYLKSYISTYVKTEIQMEQVVRKLDPFKNFLEVCAQMNGKLLNFSKIGKEVGVDTKTIITYYQILEDTYLGFMLPAFHTSLRKSILLTPKFYFFDTGVKRALEQTLLSDVVPSTSYYGEVFEHFVISEIYKLNHYYEADYKLSYFSTKDGLEVDLVLSRGKKEVIFIEIKSSEKIDQVEVNKLAKLTANTKIKTYYLSLDPIAQAFAGVRCLLWSDGIKEIFEEAK
ncbi:MAG: ATP-binding protein [Bdellovibrio sp.]|nr:ATP-binding protein [Bdellovibrio sp.]